ncbi:hypothetical protein DEA98_07010 [Brucella pseudogrignonensis]|nr:hypothetical protein [Brucella pseudogrignonensis]
MDVVIRALNSSKLMRKILFAPMDTEPVPNVIPRQLSFLRQAFAISTTFEVWIKTAQPRCGFFANQHPIDRHDTNPACQYDTRNSTGKGKELWPHTLMSLERGDPPSRIVSECRSIMDVCLKELGATQGGRRQRIAHLKASHVLTEDLAAWGEFLWDDGNDAVHDIEATHEDARKHVEYLKLFLVSRSIFQQTLGNDAGKSQLHSNNEFRCF